MNFRPYENETRFTPSVVPRTKIHSFTSGTTEGVNLVAFSYGRKFIGEGDEILVSQMEHHSNIIPWQMIAEEKGAVIRVIPMNERGELIIDEYENMLNGRTKMVALTHVSNSLGTVNPIKDMIATAHKFGVPVCVDAAQSVPHFPVDVQDLDCDFFIFSGHKMFGPTGSGVMYGKRKWLDQMPPYQTGGGMIRTVSFEKTTFAPIPDKFEAGTPDIAGVIGLGAAIDFLQSMDREKLILHEVALMIHASEELKKIKGVRIIGTATEKTAIVSFIIEGVNALDAGMYLDTLGIAVRTGQHCTEPVMKRFNIPGTIRASFMFYNTIEEVDVFIDGVKKAISFLKR